MRDRVKVAWRVVRVSGEGDGQGLRLGLRVGGRVRARVRVREPGSRASSGGSSRFVRSDLTASSCAAAASPISPRRVHMYWG